jgi:hypothetical protein
MGWFARVAVAGSVAGAALITVAPAASALPRFVGPGQSIQRAINRASAGDEIIVTGHHAENVLISKDGIRLIGLGAVITPPARPLGNICANPSDPASAPGICVVGDIAFPDPNGPPVVHRMVSDVSVSGFTVQGFSGDGIFVFGAQDAAIWGNQLLDDGDYGVFANSSSGTTIAFNVTTNAKEAGIYVGDSPQASALVFRNVTSGNNFGIFVRNAEHGVIESNHVWGNCIGVLVLADAPGPAGAFTIHGNLINDNSKVCAASEDGPPALSGLGVALAGAHDVSVTENWIAHNVPAGPTDVKGGVVLALQDPKKPVTGQTPPMNNTVRNNVLKGNDPDIFSDGNGTGNVLQPNVCTTSTPATICAAT